MSHYVLEVVIPPDCDVAKSVASILAPFDENAGDDEDGYSKHAFWDFYVIGGRWSGDKLSALIEPERLTAFRQSLIDCGVTCSSLQCGKQKLKPESQIPMVDAMWREAFPELAERCPQCVMFDHARDQYGRGGNYAPDDVCRVSELPIRWQVERLIIAGPGYSDERKKWDDWQNPKAAEMWQTEFWNGVSWLKTAWNGNVREAIDELRTRENERTRRDIGDDWLCVTVDYHT